MESNGEIKSVIAPEFFEQVERLQQRLLTINGLTQHPTTLRLRCLELAAAAHQGRSFRNDEVMHETILGAAAIYYGYVINGPVPHVTGQVPPTSFNE